MKALYCASAVAICNITHAESNVWNISAINSRQDGRHKSQRGVATTEHDMTC